MSQTCLTQAALALHTCHSHAIHRQHTFHMHTFMNAQAYCTTCKNAISSMHIQHMHTRCMYGPHKKYSSCTHATLTCITYATFVTYTSMLHAKDTHCVHLACKPHATHACVHATLILHMLHAHYCHAHSTYLFCMHAHYTQICRLLAAACLLHAKHM